MVHSSLFIACQSQAGKPGHLGPKGLLGTRVEAAECGPQAGLPGNCLLELGLREDQAGQPSEGPGLPPALQRSRAEHPATPPEVHGWSK